VLAAQAAGATAEVAQAMVTMELDAHPNRPLHPVEPQGPVGSGFLCQPIPSVVYFVPSLLAAKHGGLPAVFGMTIAAGVFEVALARALPRLRALFPPEIAGLVVLLAGIATGVVGLRTALGAAGHTAAPTVTDVTLAIATLAIMVALNVWGRGPLRLFCVLIGMGAGYAAAWALGRIDAAGSATASAAALFALPGLGHLGWTLDPTLALPFAALGLLFYLMPRPVAGAALVFSSTFIVINGLEIMTSRLLDARRTLVIGLAIVFGLAVEVFPGLLEILPPAARVALGTSLVLGTLVGLGLNVLFRIGLRRTGSLTVRPDAVDPNALEQFMDEQGASWGARRDVIERAKFNLEQSIETLASSGVASGPLEVEASFDEFNLDVRVSYEGPPLELPERRPSNEEIMASEEGERRLAGFMLRRFADRVAATYKGNRSMVLFHFDH
jgi:hypothetical protein